MGYTHYSYNCRAELSVNSLDLLQHRSVRKDSAGSGLPVIQYGYFDGKPAKITVGAGGVTFVWGRSPQSARGLAIRMERKSKKLIESSRAVLQTHLG